LSLWGARNPHGIRLNELLMLKNSSFDWDRKMGRVNQPRTHIASGTANGGTSSSQAQRIYIKCCSHANPQPRYSELNDRKMLTAHISNRCFANTSRQSVLVNGIEAAHTNELKTRL
jgi:hypothetical protein